MRRACGSAHAAIGSVPSWAATDTDRAARSGPFASKAGASQARAAIAAKLIWNPASARDAGWAASHSTAASESAFPIGARTPMRRPATKSDVMSAARVTGARPPQKEA